MPPQRSESTKSQNAPVPVQSVTEGSHKKGFSSPTPPNAVSSSLDFHTELSSRLKRQQVGSRSTNSPSRSLAAPSTAVSVATLTAEMIQESKSKLKATNTTISASDSQSTPSVPAWKELVAQRKLKNADSSTSKRMSWTPTSNSSSSFKQIQQMPTNADTFPDVLEEEEESGCECVAKEIPSVMSQSVTCGNTSTALLSSVDHPSYEELLKRLTDLCADLNLAKVNLPNEHNSTLVDRIEDLKQACLGYVDEVNCSAHAKFRFRDECARLQNAADSLRAICGGSVKVPVNKEHVGRRKTIQNVHNTVEGIHQSLLRLGPLVPPNGTVEETSASTTGSGLISTDVIS